MKSEKKNSLKLKVAEIFFKTQKGWKRKIRIAFNIWNKNTKDIEIFQKV